MKTYVWSLTARISHWLVFSALVITYFLGGEEEYINAHAALGYLAGILIIFRIFWGISGPRYSRFSDFPTGINKIREFMTNMRVSKLQYAGHNPVASIIMIAIFLAILLVVLSGMANLAAEGQGLLQSINLNWQSELFEDTHEVMVNILIVLVLIHLAGIFVDTIFHKESGTLASIFTGYKRIPGENVKLNTFQKLFGIVWIAGSLSFFAWVMTTQDIKLSESEKIKSEIEESGENDENDD